jgi:hypothetical protein
VVIGSQDEEVVAVCATAHENAYAPDLGAEQDLVTAGAQGIDFVTPLQLAVDLGMVST